MAEGLGHSVIFKPCLKMLCSQSSNENQHNIQTTFPRLSSALCGLSLPALLATSRTNHAHLRWVLDTLLSMSLQSVRDFFCVCSAACHPLCEPHGATLKRPCSLMCNAGSIIRALLPVLALITWSPSSGSKQVAQLTWQYGEGRHDKMTPTTVLPVPHKKNCRFFLNCNISTW